MATLEELKQQFLQAKANGDTATVSGIQNTVQADKNMLTQQQAQTNMQTVKDNFLQAKANGASTTGMSEQYAGAQNAYNNALNTPKPNFDMNSFMNNYMNYMKGSYDNAKLAETALANQKMQQDLVAQEEAKRQGEKDYTDTLGGINKDTYNAYENAKIRGMERGVMYSAQQSGVDAGIASRNIANKQQAKEVRDLRLGSIRDKINAIKSGNLAELQSIEANYNSKLQEAMGNAYLKATDNQWDLDKMAIQQGYEQSNMQLQQQNTLTNMGLQQKYDLEKIDINNANDIAKLDTMFKQDLEKMAVDQSYKVELQNMDNNFKKEFLKLETAEKKNLMAFDTEQQKVIMALDQQHKMAILGAQNSNDMAQLKAKYDMETQSAMRDIVSSIIMNDPNFTAYPTTAEQGKMMNDMLGVISGKKSVDQFVTENYKNLPSGKKPEVIANVQQQIDALSGAQQGYPGYRGTNPYGDGYVYPN